MAQERKDINYFIKTKNVGAINGHCILKYKKKSEVINFLKDCDMDNAVKREVLNSWMSFMQNAYKTNR